MSISYSVTKLADVSLQLLHAIRRMKETQLRRLFDHWRDFTPHPEVVDRALQWEFSTVAGESSLPLSFQAP